MLSDRLGEQVITNTNKVSKQGGIRQNIILLVGQLRMRPN
jgi:hypothetical protein